MLEFEYMLSDLSEVIRNTDKPLAEGQVKSYMLMLLKGVAFCHENNIMHRVSVAVLNYMYLVHFIPVYLNWILMAVLLDK